MYRRRRGFAIVMAMVGLTLVGGAIFLLARASSAMLFESNKAYAEASSYNLESSALVWARRNAGRRGMIELDVSQMGVPAGSLSVALSDSGGGKKALQIRTECRRGRMTIRRSSDHVIK